MYTNKQRAELADICYMTIEKECSKPVGEINTELIDACLDLANKLLNIQPLSEEEISVAKKKILFKTARRKKLKVRIIAAVIAVILALATTACAFSDWLVGVFGLDTLYNVQPGEAVEMEQHDIEMPSDILYFDTIDELIEYVDEPIYIPMELPEEYVLSSIAIRQYENKEIEIIWTKDSHNIRYKITFKPSYFDEELFKFYEYEYYSKYGHPYDLMQIGTYWQAMGWIDNNEYIISSNDEGTIKSVIDSMVFVD